MIIDLSTNNGSRMIIDLSTNNGSRMIIDFITRQDFLQKSIAAKHEQLGKFLDLKLKINKIKFNAAHRAIQINSNHGLNKF